MEMTLHAGPHDLILNAIWETDRSAGKYFSFPYYLTDPQGNYLVDPQGNRLVGPMAEFLYPQILSALPDDHLLNAPEMVTSLTSLPDDFRLNAE